MAADRGSLRGYPIEQPQHGEPGVAKVDRFDVLPPWGPHRDGLELAEHRRVVVADHEGHYSVHRHHHVRRG